MLGIDRRSLLTAAASVAVAAPFIARARAGEPIRIKWGNDLAMAHPLNVRMKTAVAAIAKETDGAVAIDLFPNNQLGGDTDMMTQMRTGALEGGTLPGVIMSTLIRWTSITGLGFVFSDYDKVWAAMDGALGDFLRRKIAAEGLTPLHRAFDNGFRQITTSTKPIRTVADLKGLKIRLPVVPLWMRMFVALGASPIGIAVSEAYTALQTHIADGQENPLPLIEVAKFYEVQKYCSLTNHAWDGFWPIMNTQFWNTVPADIRAIVEKHIDAAVMAEREDIAKGRVARQTSLQSKGLIFNTVDQAPFRQALRDAGFYARSKEGFGDEAWRLLEQSVGELG